MGSKIYEDNGQYRDEWMTFIDPIDDQLADIVAKMRAYLEAQNAPALDYLHIGHYIAEHISLYVQSAWLDHVEEVTFETLHKEAQIADAAPTDNGGR